MCENLHILFRNEPLKLQKERILRAQNVLKFAISAKVFHISYVVYAVSAPSLPTCRCRLRTFLFQKFYPDIIMYLTFLYWHH